MSPTEFELRAALRDGEGDGIDPDRVILRAEEARRRQRSRVLGAASVAAVLAAVTVTGTALLGGSGGSSRIGGADSSAAVGIGGRALPADNAAAAPSAPCPVTFPHLSAPRPGTSGIASGQPGTRAIFATPPRAVTICSYGAAGEPPTRSGATTVSGAAAQQLVTSLDQASPARPQVCPQYVTADTRRYAFVGVAANGSRTGVVTVLLSDNSCLTTVTNGAAVRYGWRPPAAVAGILAALDGSAAPSTPAPSTHS
jgi:hypothetical protein